MSGYLEGYGEADARRSRRWKLFLGVPLLLALAGTILWFAWLRNFQERRQTDRFFAALRAGNYDAAYRLFGCSPETPCRDYAYAKFIEDWGPKSPRAGLPGMTEIDHQSCDAGYILNLRFGQDDRVDLFVDRDKHLLGYAPFPICDGNRYLREVSK
jgi:hypothetical protein